MASDRDVRAGEIFKAALERDAAERSAFVHQQCGNDAKLQFEVESLLRADDAAASEFLARSPIAGAASISSLEEVADRLVGRQVGPYQVRRLIAP